MARGGGYTKLGWGMVLSLNEKEDKQIHLDTTSKMHMKTKRLVITLKDNIDMAMSQPSLQICDKLDPSIIE